MLVILFFSLSVFGTENFAGDGGSARKGDEVGQPEGVRLKMNKLRMVNMVKNMNMNSKAKKKKNIP